MTRLYAGILFTIMLLNMPPFNQAGKLPFLLKHYQTHKQQNPELTLGQFISIHYLGCDALAKDVNEHKRLPFHNADHIQQAPSLAPPETAGLPLRHIEHVNIQRSGYQGPFIPNSIQQNIFRPPKA